MHAIHFIIMELTLLEKEKKYRLFLSNTVKMHIFQQRVHAGYPCLVTKFGVLNVHLHFKLPSEPAFLKGGIHFP